MASFSLTYSGISEALDVKPFPGEGTSSAEPLYIEVGRICAFFQGLEDEIVRLFQLLCGGPADGRSNMAHIIGVTSSFNAKIDLTKEAAKAFLASEPDKRDAVLSWLQLCRRAAEIRNKVVHGHPVQIRYVHEGHSLQAAFLLPSWFDPKGAASSDEVAYCWNAQQLQEYAAALHALTAMLMTVREELAGTAEEPQPHVLDPSVLVRGKPEGTS